MHRSDLNIMVRYQYDGSNNSRQGDTYYFFTKGRYSKPLNID